MTSAKEWAELVKKVAEQRDRVAFEALFDHFAPRIKGYLMRLGSDPALAEEVTQDAMTTLWRKAGQFDPGKSSVATWLFRIARNRRIDFGRRERLDYMDPLDAAFTQIPAEGTVDGAVNGMQRDDTVRTLVTALPDEQRALINDAFYEGLSHSQIAEKTGLPLGTVKSRIRLAFNRLRKMLEQRGVSDADS